MTVLELYEHSWLSAGYGPGIHINTQIHQPNITLPDPQLEIWVKKDWLSQRQ